MNRHLEHEVLLDLHGAALSAHLAKSRGALLAGLDPAFVASLVTAQTPSDQVLQDLHALNSAGSLSDGTTPLRTWLRNAIQLCSIREEALVFQRVFDQISYAHGIPPGTRGDVPRPDQTQPASDVRASKQLVRITWLLTGMTVALVAAHGRLIYVRSDSPSRSAIPTRVTVSSGAENPTIIMTKPSSTPPGAASSVAPHSPSGSPVFASLPKIELRDRREKFDCPYLRIDDVIAKADAEQISIDVRIRNPDRATISITRAEIFLAEVARPLGAQIFAGESMTYNVSDTGPLVDLAISHVLRGSEADRFVIKIGKSALHDQKRKWIRLRFNGSCFVALSFEVN